MLLLRCLLKEKSNNERKITIGVIQIYDKSTFSGRYPGLEVEVEIKIYNLDCLTEHVHKAKYFADSMFFKIYSLYQLIQCFCHQLHTWTDCA